MRSPKAKLRKLFKARARRRDYVRRRNLNRHAPTIKKVEEVPIFGQVRTGKKKKQKIRLVVTGYKKEVVKLSKFTELKPFVPYPKSRKFTEPKKKNRKSTK